MTAGPNYRVIVLGRIFHDVAAIFKSTSVVALENCLDDADSLYKAFPFEAIVIFSYKLLK